MDNYLEQIKENSENFKTLKEYRKILSSAKIKEDKLQKSCKHEIVANVGNDGFIHKVGKINYHVCLICGIVYGISDNKNLDLFSDSKIIECEDYYYYIEKLLVNFREMYIEEITNNPNMSVDEFCELFKKRKNIKTLKK